MPWEVAQRPPAMAATPRTMLNDFPGARRKPCTGWRCFHADGTPTPAGVPGYFGGQCTTPTMTAPGTCPRSTAGCTDPTSRDWTVDAEAAAKRAISDLAATTAAAQDGHQGRQGHER